MLFFCVIFCMNWNIVWNKLKIHVPENVFSYLHFIYAVYTFGMLFGISFHFMLSNLISFNVIGIKKKGVKNMYLLQYNKATSKTAREQKRLLQYFYFSTLNMLDWLFICSYHLTDPCILFLCYFPHELFLVWNKLKTHFPGNIFIYLHFVYVIYTFCKLFSIYFHFMPTTLFFLK